MSKVFIVASPLETGYSQDIKGHPIFYSGVGKINATIAAMKVIHDGYNEIINIGSCGSLSLKVGEIVKIGKIYQDIDATPLCEYGETPFENCKEINISDSGIKCFTTDYFVDINQMDKYSSFYKSMINECDIFDMECFAIAKVCERFNVDFKSYKWVSDNGGDVSWEENCKLGFENVIKIL
jgi:adenosylhomocysteine nucleosidase